MNFNFTHEIQFKKNKFKIFILILLIVISTVGIQKYVLSSESHGNKFLQLTVEGTVTAGTNQYIQEGIEQAEQGGYQGIIIRLDTPGGLVDATLDIISAISNSQVPVITHVGPTGSIAGSAGAFILVSGHIASMSPGTTTGAAMPVTMQPGEDGEQTADEKTINFLAGHIKSIAGEHGRPEDVVERFVTENLTLNANEALEKEVIEYIESTPENLLETLHGETIVINDKEIILDTENAIIDKMEMNLSQQLNHFISNPQITLILFLLGIYGIIFGLNMPGTVIPELGGGIALVLALFGLGMFEANTLGIILIVFSVILFVAEAFTPTFGIFTAAGVVTLILGGFFLPMEPMLSEEWFSAFRMTVIGMASVTAIYLGVVITKLVKLREKSIVHEKLGMEGYYGTTNEVLDPIGYVKIRGELWKAKSYNQKVIPKNSKVIVVNSENMILVVSEVPEREIDSETKS